MLRLVLVLAIIRACFSFFFPTRSSNVCHACRAVSDEQALQAMERLEKLDARFGVGQGATKERTKWTKIVEEWEQQEESHQVEEDCDYKEESEENDESSDTDFWDSNKFVERHTADERVAVFGGDPSQRRQSVEKKLAPYQSLDQFGTPRDVGPSDTSKLLRKIRSGSYDVVYLWTRFNCHSSRDAIRLACVNTGTRYHEVESLAYVRKAPTASTTITK